MIDLDISPSVHRELKDFSSNSDAVSGFDTHSLPPDEKLPMATRREDLRIYTLKDY